MKEINFKAIEKKWQNKWEKKKCFQVKEGKGKKFYVLEMFPYPSGSGLHMGHALNYTIGDIFARFKRMQGFNVLYPMGYDSLGLPAENAAIKQKVNPKTYTEKSIKNFIVQQKSLGLSYDWDRMFKTHDPDYYKWDQWIFLKMFEKGLVHKKQSPVNWCPKCNTVLANEQVHNGKCWIHDTVEVEIKYLNQWYLKITDYVEELNDFKELNKWPEVIKKLQKNWIGKSYGAEVLFEINKEKWPVFTTRPDTIYGVTFMVVSAQHSRLKELVTDEQKIEVENFVDKLNSVSEEEIEQLDKQGVFTGSYAINPINKEKIPVYAGNFVLADYGGGMVMAVPGHDQRDFDFAKKYNLQIKEVISGGNRKETQVSLTSQPSLKKAYIGEGVLVNSGKFNGIQSKRAINEIIRHLEKRKLGKKTINFRLKDWLISRQRYWGTPIPIVYCDNCGLVPIPEKDLPVKLPERVKFGKGNPLETSSSFINTKCPKCKGKAKRETDTMDTFANSSWYYLRYCDPQNKKNIFDKKKTDYWCPVDLYIGGKEHACMHLIYIRFYTKFLRDLGLLKINEPSIRLFNQGMLHGLDGEKMSKSKGNVVLPEKVSKKYGIDTARLFLVSIASPDKDVDWSEKGIQGSLKFIKKVFDYFDVVKIGKSSLKIQSKVNKTIKEITQDIENLRYNLGVIKLRQLFENLEQEKEIARKDLESFLKILSVFCPHVSEELWEKINGKGFISLAKWPVFYERKINKKLEKQEEQIEKLVEDIYNILSMIKEKKKKVYIYVLPNEKQIYLENIDLIKKKIRLSLEIFAVNDKIKYDPDGKSRKAKPGKPAVYLE